METCKRESAKENGFERAAGVVNVVVIDLGGMARFLGGQSGRAWAMSGDVLVDGTDERAPGRARDGASGLLRIEGRKFQVQRASRGGFGASRLLGGA